MRYPTNTKTSGRRIIVVLLTILLAASACSADGTTTETPQVAVTVLDDGTPGTATADAAQTPESSGDEFTAAETEAPAADPASTPEAAERALSPGAACREAGFDFEPWLTICTQSQTDRAERLIYDPLTDVVQTIPITAGDRIADGLPEVGAGYISEANESVAYTFELQAGEAVFVVPETSGWSQGCSLGPPAKLVNYQAFAPDGTQLGKARTNDNCSRGSLPIVAVEDGTYTLVVGAWTDSVISKDGLTTYAFKVSKIQVDRFDVSLGQEISLGSLGAGSGDIETEGSTDVYTLNLAEGQAVNLVRVAFNGSCSVGVGPGLEWTVTAPSGEVLINRADLTGNCRLSNDDPEWIADQAGEYTIAISGMSWRSTNKAVDYAIILEAW